VIVGVRWFGMAGSGAGEGWGASVIDGNQPGIGHLLEDVVDAIKYGIELSHGMAKPLNVGLKVVESLVVA